MELRDLVVVAERVGPPSQDEIQTGALKVLEEFPAAVGGSRKLLLLCGSRFRFGSLVLEGRFNDGDRAEVLLVVKSQNFVGLIAGVEGLEVGQGLCSLDVLRVGAFGRIVDCRGGVGYHEVGFDI